MDLYTIHNHQDLMDKYVHMIQEKPEVESLIKMINTNQEILIVLIELIKQDKGSIKFYAEKIIRKMSEVEPIKVYPYFQEMIQFIDSPNHFIQWGTIQTIANLVTVDTNKYFDSFYDKYFDLINSSTMVTTANVLEHAWKIVLARPEFENDITKRLINIQNNTYYMHDEPSPECKNILIGHAIDCFDRYFDISKSKTMILKFVEDSMRNDRKSTVIKASKFIKKYDHINRKHVER